MPHDRTPAWPPLLRLALAGILVALLIAGLAGCANPPKPVEVEPEVRHVPVEEPKPLIIRTPPSNRLPDEVPLLPVPPTHRYAPQPPPAPCSPKRVEDVRSLFKRPCPPLPKCAGDT